MKKKNSYYYFLLFLTALIWGSSFVFTKHLLEFQTPIFIIFFRLVIASLIMTGISIIFYRKELLIGKKNLLKIAILSVFEPFFYFIFETYSLQYSDTSVVSVIIATIPLFTALLSIYYFKEAFSKLNLWGVIISIAGIFIMLYPGLAGLATNKTGIILAFCAVFTAVAYGFILKKLPETIPPVVVITYQNFIGLILFFPLFIFINSERDIATGIQALENPKNLIFLLSLAIFCSSIAFILFIKGMRHLGLGKANTFTNLIPVVTAVISFLLLNEEFPVNKIFGIIVVISGLFLVQSKK